MTKSSRSFWDKFWKDEQGNVAVWQWPNIPLAGWFVFMLLSKLFSAGAPKNGFHFLSVAFLFTWSYLEIRSGASYFRRLLGLVIFLMIVHSHFK
jgi:hypothetical protein